MFTQAVQCLTSAIGHTHEQCTQSWTPHEPKVKVTMHEEK